jgi:hypothetical protein
MPVAPDTSKIALDTLGKLHELISGHGPESVLEQ